MVTACGGGSKGPKPSSTEEEPATIENSQVKEKRWNEVFSNWYYLNPFGNCSIKMDEYAIVGGTLEETNEFFFDNGKIKIQVKDYFPSDGTDGTHQCCYKVEKLENNLVDVIQYAYENEDGYWIEYPVDEMLYDYFFEKDYIERINYQYSHSWKYSDFTFDEDKKAYIASSVEAADYKGDKDEFENIEFYFKNNELRKWIFERSGARFVIQIYNIGKTSVELPEIVEPDTSHQISVAVDNNLVNGYKRLLSNFKNSHPEYDEYEFEIIGSDVGSMAGQMVADNKACPDIVTISSDNIGKLYQTGNIKPFSDETLVPSIKENTPDNFNPFLDYFVEPLAIPVQGQASMLFYDKRFVSEEQSKSFEGLFQAAEQYAAKYAVSNVKGVTITGLDGYSFSFPLLARINETKETSVRLYDNFTNESGHTWIQGDDQVAIGKYIRKAYKNQYGLITQSDIPWLINIMNHVALSVIGGSWNYDAFERAVGEENVGINLIPTFTIDEESAFGSVKAGTTFRGGAFADYKCFVLNSAVSDEKAVIAEELAEHLSSVDSQEWLFKQFGIVPAYNSFDINSYTSSDVYVSHNEFEMVKAQIGMYQYGIPQPFVEGKLNNYYYSKGAIEYYQQMMSATREMYFGDFGVQTALYQMQYVFQKGSRPTEIPSTLPQDI